MKYFITATASVLAVLLSSVIASPTYLNINARQSGSSVCDFSRSVVNGKVNVFSIASETESDNLLSLNFFGVSADNVASNQLGVFKQSVSTPDPNASFDLLPSRVNSSDPLRFILQQQSDHQEVALNSDFTTFSSAPANSGTEFDISCGPCVQGPESTLSREELNNLEFTVFASQCSMAMPADSAQSGKCITVDGSSNGPVSLSSCDPTLTTQSFSFVFVGSF